MKALLFFAFCLFTFSYAKAGLQRMTLTDALRAKVIKVDATGNGGYQGRGLKLHVTNNTGNPIQLTIDQGVIFRPADTAQQDLVTSGMEMLALLPFKDGMTDAQTFCAKSYAGSPVSGQSFSFLKKGSDTLVQVLSFLKLNFLLDRPIAQNAVWVVTNHHSLDAVYDDGNPMLTTRLQDFLASVTGKPKPEVFKTYALGSTPGQPVYNPKVLKIFAQLEVLLDEPEKLTLGVYDDAGKMVQKVFENQQFAGKKGHRFKVEFEASGVEPGRYFIRLKKGDEMLQEKSTTVE